MPLPPDAGREPVHHRQISIRGYRRRDGLWDVEGHLNDVRPRHFRYPGGERAANLPIHSMWLRLIVAPGPSCATAASRRCAAGGRRAAASPRKTRARARR